MLSLQSLLSSEFGSQLSAQGQVIRYCESKIAALSVKAGTYVIEQRDDGVHKRKIFKNRFLTDNSVLGRI